MFFIIFATQNHQPRMLTLPLLKKQAITLLLLLICQQALSATAKPIDKLIEQFNKAEQQTYGKKFDRQTVNTANAVFKLLQHENITDEPLTFSYDTPADSLREQLWYWVAEYYYAYQEYQQAAFYASKSLPLFQKASDNEGLANCLNLLAITHIRLSEFQKAAEHAMHCYKLDMKSGDPEKISSSLNTLTAIYMSTHQYREAEKFILQAMKEASKTDNKSKIALLKGMASEVYNALGNQTKSLAYAKEAYDIETKLGHTDKAAIRLTQMSTALIWMHHFGEAKRVLAKAIPILEKTHNNHSLGIAYINWGEVLLNEHNNQAAAEYFQKAVAIFNIQNEPNGESKAQLGLYKATKDTRPQVAMEALERHKALKDSIFDQQTAESLGRYNAQVGNIKLSQENEEQRRAKQRAIIVGIATTLLLTIIAIGVWTVMRRSNIKQSKVNSSLNKNIDELRLQYQQLQQQYSQISERASTVSDTSNLHSDDKQFIEKLIDIINEQMAAGNIDATTVSSRMNMSPFQLRTRLATLLDETPKNFIQSIRMKRALHYLENHPYKNINEVATLCAYNETSNFTRAFKNTFGLTPTQYLEEKQRKQSANQQQQ